MNVLWIKSDFPVPADSGGKIRTLELLQELSRNCTISFLSYAPPDLDPKCRATMERAGIEVLTVPRREERKAGLAFALRVLAKLFSPRPYVINKYVDREMADAITARVKAGTADVIVVDFLDMSWCLDVIDGTPTVLFEHNVETVLWRRRARIVSNPLLRIYLAYECRRVARAERAAVARADLTLTVSNADTKQLAQDFGGQRLLTIPTGVDSSYFQPQGNEVPGRLVMCGSMDWAPNIDGFEWFYREVYPHIQAELPYVSLSVVGRRPSPELVALGHADPTLFVTGTVADVRPHVAEAALFVVPLRVGGGTRIKIYEAMAMEKCVVATSLAAEGLPVEDGRDLILADDAGAFAQAVTRLLQSKEERESIARGARRMVAEQHTWTEAARILHDGLKNVGSGGEP